MRDVFTQTRVDEAIGLANDFLTHERGTQLDGDFAAASVRQHVASVAEQAEEFLTAIPYPNQQGLYVPLSKLNAHMFSKAVAVLPGHIVLVTPQLVGEQGSSFYPAVVSEDGTKTGMLRLHVMHRPFRQKLGRAAATFLSSAGQSETSGIGQHGRLPSDGVEAEHFATLLTAGSDPDVGDRWLAGEHVNHTWRKSPNDSVTSRVNNMLLDENTPQSTVTLTQQQFKLGKAILLWHEALRNANNKPETATRSNALLVVQGLGFEALKTRSPKSLDTLKRLLA